MKIGNDSPVDLGLFEEVIPLRSKEFEYYAKSFIFVEKRKVYIKTTNELNGDLIFIELKESDLFRLRGILESADSRCPYMLENLSDYNKNKVNTLYVGYHPHDKQMVIAPKPFNLDPDKLQENIIMYNLESHQLGEFDIWRSDAFVIIQDSVLYNSPIVIHRNTLINALAHLAFNPSKHKLVAFGLLRFNHTSFKLADVAGVIAINEGVYFNQDNKIFVFSKDVAKVLMKQDKGHNYNKDFPEEWSTKYLSSLISDGECIQVVNSFGNSTSYPFAMQVTHDTEELGMTFNEDERLKQNLSKSTLFTK